MITDIAIRRPVFTTMVMVACMILGVVSFFRLGVDLFPDISFPIVSITTVYPGAGPEEVERSVSRPIEDAVGTLARVDEVRSYSREGVSIVVVTFEIGTDIDNASIDVRDRVSGARYLMPSDVEDPSFLKIDPSAAPVMTLVLSAPASPREVFDQADDIVRPLLERVPGVAVVNVRGGSVREIAVDLDAVKLASFGLTVAQVSQALASENLDVPAGRLEQGATETSLRVQGEVADPAQLSEIAVAVVGGEVVHVGDVGTVRDAEEDRRTLVRVGGKEAVSLEVIKQGGQNTVAVSDGIHEALSKAHEALPAGSDLQVVSDTSIFIRENAEDVETSIVVGGLAAIAIIFLFMLDWRSTLISALALPTSVVTTFAFMYAAGFTLNMMTLLGLSLAIGFLIDDAIVVRENIFRHIEAGESPMEAASKGTREVALAVLATTFTILAVFVPVAFMGGMMGQFFQQFALTISGAVTVSLFVAFTLDPMLSARLVKPIDPDQVGHGTRHAGLFGVIQRALDALDEAYRGVLAWALRWQKTVMLLAVLVFVTSLGAISLTGSEFFPKPDRGQFAMSVTMPAGTSLELASTRVAELERTLLADPDIELVYSTIGVNQEARKATIRVSAGDKRDRDRGLNDIMADLRATFAEIPGVRVSMQEVGLIEGDADIRQAPINLGVQGPDLDTLARFADEVSEIVRSTPGTADVDSTYAPGLPELRAVVNRGSSDHLGAPAAQVGAALRSAVVGDVPTRLRDGEDDVDVRVRLRPEDRADRSALDGLLVMTRSGPAPLRQLATLTDDTGPSTIERADRQRQITVTANTVGRSLGEVVADIEARLEKMNRPPGYSVKTAGEAERMRESVQAFGLALVLAVIFVYVVLASQFESFVHPITIMVSLPLAIVGALLGLFLTGWAMGMSSLIGIILLMGLVTKNAILLVDRANQNRDERGMDQLSAILEAGPVRLRPILMTSAAMVLGMMPTALSQGPGSEFRAPMAIAVIGGVITSTVLTLVVVPVVYVWLDRFTGRARRERARVGRA